MLRTKDVKKQASWEYEKYMIFATKINLVKYACYSQCFIKASNIK